LVTKLVDFREGYMDEYMLDGRITSRWKQIHYQANIVGVCIGKINLHGKGSKYKKIYQFIFIKKSRVTGKIGTIQEI
jgi:hypothetical protein